ncbi:hypothetical protein CYLTODRAFT_414648 [Cylindrobasidium torrendii FP15055 ss-10]|uniref:Uncharacterized protein n=1 Tax=Cylindrobasidium torrendii FP15055 ss-10 TaxID=1314674 RepID=A0A0D7AX40_9AGAR|nr:hypothetical protein CYLTODRAFT_414648 [Cylindrobasidium torrendii FP15055 ss-10]
MSRKSKRFANRGIQVPSGMEDHRDEGDMDNVELVTPGVRRAQSERSKEHVDHAPSVEEVEDEESDDKEGDGNDDEESDGNDDEESDGNDDKESDGNDDEEDGELRICDISLDFADGHYLSE